jgi:aerobic carbon-monoxide dehydrogenase small subunit
MDTAQMRATAQTIAPAKLLWRLSILSPSPCVDAGWLPYPLAIASLFETAYAGARRDNGFTQQSMRQHYQLRVNGANVDVEGDGSRPLLDFLREDLRLTGTKRGCGIGACGSCTVLVDGKPRRACRLKLEEIASVVTRNSLLVTRTGGDARDKPPTTAHDIRVTSHESRVTDIVTIEGLSTGHRLHPIQQAFIDCGAIQCGFCTPGMVLAAKALLDANPRPSRDEIKKALAGNLCRCTGYQQIFEAIEEAARQIASTSSRRPCT